MSLKQSKKYSKKSEWQHNLVLFVSGLLLFETLTGLSIYFLPFSVSNQVMVLTHTIIGLVFIIPFTWYQIRHWLKYRSMKMNHFMLTGYISMIITAIAAISGLILTYQAVFLTKISSTWDLIHIVSTFALIAFLVPHLVLIMIRDYQARETEAIKPIIKAESQYIKGTLIISIILFAFVVLWVSSYKPVKMNNEFPDDYSLLYGPDRPFAPSLADTHTGGALDAQSLGGSEGCGTSGCHEEIFKEWQVSAHRYSAMDVGFQKVQSLMAQQNGPESTRYCGGCHDPISLFSGSKNIYTDEDDLTNDLGYQEGVSCIACHAIKETDIKGNANYVITQPKRYMFEMMEGESAKIISDFLIRSYPRYHVESLQHKLFKSPEFCAGCHKQFIDEEINQVGWVQLQNQYDSWRKSRWNHPGDPTKTVECRECHMPLTESLDPGSGDDLDYNRSKNDKKHRNHRFLAANQFLPIAMDLPGAEEHVALTKKWLQGKFDIPEIADKWKEGPAVPLELVVPDQVVPGEDVKIHVVITNNKVGHEFPTGPLDIIQAWVEINVTDQDGNVIFTSGMKDQDHFIEPGTFIFKAEPVDQYGNLIDKHNLWDMVGVRYRRSMFPGFSDQAEFSFPCPSALRPMDTEPFSQTKFEFRMPAQQVTQLQVSAKLLYRKFDQFLLNFLFGEESGVTAPVTVLSEDHKIINVTGEGL